MGEGDLLALLVEYVVVVGVLQGVDAVVAVCHSFYYELSAAVSARYAQHRLLGEDGVAEVTVQAYEYAFDGLEVLRVEHVAGHFHRVYVVACGERVGIVAQRIVFVVVGYGVGEVNGVGGVGLERVFQLDNDFLSRRRYFRLFDLRGRYYDFFRRVVYLYIFVEVNAYFLLLDVYSLVLRRCAHDDGRRLVVPSAVGLPHLGARHHGQGRQQGQPQHVAPRLIWLIRPIRLMGRMGPMSQMGYYVAVNLHS